MARIKSHVWSQARGSVAGITYLTNQFHQIVARQRTNPVQPNTNYQTGIKSAFDGAEAAWENLTDQQRQDWADFAATCEYPGPLGNYTVPGRQLFVGTIALRDYVVFFLGAGIIGELDTAPVVAGWYPLSSITVGVYGGATQGIAVDIQNYSAQEGVYMADRSIGFNATRLRYKGPWLSSQKSVGTIVGSGSQHIDIDTPAAMLGKICFSRTRCFSAKILPGDPEPHKLAFPAILRHTVEAGPI